MNVESLISETILKKSIYLANRLDMRLSMEDPMHGRIQKLVFFDTTYNERRVKELSEFGAHYDLSVLTKNLNLKNIHDAQIIYSSRTNAEFTAVKVSKRFHERLIHFFAEGSDMQAFYSIDHPYFEKYNFYTFPETKNEENRRIFGK